MKHLFFFCVLIVVLCFSSCSNDDLFIGDDQQKIDYLEKEYGLKKVSDSEMILEDLPATSIDDLSKFMQGLKQLKNEKIPIRFISNSKATFKLTVDDRIKLPRTKNNVEAVRVSEKLVASLALLTMNVWLDIAIPAVVDSELTGVTLFDRWDQKVSSASRNGDVIEFSVGGVWYYKLFIDGVGEFYSYTGSFSGTYNVRTGVGDLNIL